MDLVQIVILILIYPLHIQASADLESEVEEIGVSSPYIIVTHTDDDSRQYFVVVEKMILVESSNMAAALQDVMSVYFTFNIAYPRPLYPVLLFFQYHVFEIEDNQTVPNIVKIVTVLCVFNSLCCNLGSQSVDFYVYTFFA